jgi:chromate transporter
MSSRFLRSRRRFEILKGIMRGMEMVETGSGENEGRNRLFELMLLFLKLGTIGFGGPVAHIAMMEEDVVKRRKWITREHFLDLVGATNLIPGPNSTEMAIHIGYIRAGLWGLVVSGLSFILPAVMITGTLAWMYVRFGTTPAVEPFLAGIKPAVISVIAVAVYRLGKTAAKSTEVILIGVGVGGASLAGLNEIIALIAGGLIGIVLSWIKKTGSAGKVGWIGWAAPLVGYSLSMLNRSEAMAAVAMAAAQATAAPLWKLGLFFLKVGSVLYGSGYVLVAFLEGGLVQEYGWLTTRQLLDAIAIGQFTPGPVLSTATFVGYAVSGVAGAIVATVAIFLPSFLFVLVLNPIIPRLRASKNMSAFLDAINASAISLMAAVVIRLAGATVVDWRALLIAAAAFIAGLRFKLNAAWLVAGGSAAGWLLQLI